MGKRVIRLGDPTTHGGQVVSASSTTEIDGKRVARMGDKITCPIKGHGPGTIVEGDRGWTEDGKPVALEGHKCSCGCSLISTLPILERSYEGAGSASTGGSRLAASLVGRSVETRRFDEQFRAVDNATGSPVVGQPYRIETSEGQVYSGATDENGQTIRVFTADPKQIKLYWLSSLSEDEYPDADDEGIC